MSDEIKIINFKAEGYKENSNSIVNYVGDHEFKDITNVSIKYDTDFRHAITLSGNYNLYRYDLIKGAETIIKTFEKKIYTNVPGNKIDIKYNQEKHTITIIDEYDKHTYLLIDIINSSISYLYYPSDFIKFKLWSEDGKEVIYNFETNKNFEKYYKGLDKLLGNTYKPNDYCEDEIDDDEYYD